MEAICARGDTLCETHALFAALNFLHLYCATISAGLICCCAPVQPLYRYNRSWRGQNVRGLASVVLLVAWCCGAGAACLRAGDTVRLVAAVLAPLAWLAAAAFHVVLWTRHSAAPILYLAIYWFLVAVSTAAILWSHFTAGVSINHVTIYIEGLSVFLALLISGVDCVCFYDEVTKKNGINPKSINETCKITYKHNDTHFYSKILFYWLNPLLIKGYESPLEITNLGELPENEHSMKYYKEFNSIYNEQKDGKRSKGKPSMWQCYIRKVWPNFYIAGVLKLFSDMVGVVPPLGLATIIQYISEPSHTCTDIGTHVTIQEFINNGYVMLLIVTLALISQAFLSQNSTHLVTVEGTRLKTALQAMVYDKCMRLAPWSSTEGIAEETAPLLPPVEDHATTPSGLLTNLVSQDTYNIMSCVWICHYIWAIPLKIAVILYLLYTKLGVSAIIGTGVSVMLITPLQFYIGKKLSDNSKQISQCTDHRISKMAEILQGINVIKLYVWEDIFKEKILQHREVELRFLNKDSIYWSFLTFTTQISTILITVVTFSSIYYLKVSGVMTAVNVFTGLALFNQLTVPLLILPVTVLMVIQSMVSTNRIKDFLDLPESNNIREDNDYKNKPSRVLCDNFFNNIPEEVTEAPKEVDIDDEFSDDGLVTPSRNEYLVRLRNAAFTWGMKNDMLLEVDDLDIPAGKLIMVVGTTGSGKSSLLSAVLGEMYLEKGDVSYNGYCSTWYAGQPPWLLEGTVRENIVMDNPWSPQRYARVLRATGLRPDLQILTEGDETRLGSHGAPLSGGQRVRVCVARALYSSARLVALDEPLGALDAALARHVVARALLPAARTGRTVLLATNRLELLHYADLIIAMEEGRIRGYGPAGSDAVLCRWAQLAAEARAAAARLGAGPPGGSARERTHLVRALSRTRFHRTDDAPVGINEATGSHLLAEVATCAGGSWRRSTVRHRPSLTRQLSSPPPSMYNKWQREVRRTVSADEADTALQHEASLLRRLLRPKTRHQLTSNRWTPRSLKRLISSDSETQTQDDHIEAGSNDDSMADTAFSSLTSNGGDVFTNTAPNELSDSKDMDEEDETSELTIWCEYARACGWGGLAFWVAAVAAQAFTVAADCWLSYATRQEEDKSDLSSEQMWRVVSVYAACMLCGACGAGGAQAWAAAGGARARRRLHDALLHAALHAPLHHPAPPAPAHLLHRFCADIQVIDKKLPTAISRWAQLALLCVAAMLVNAVAAPWSVLALLPAFAAYLVLQSVYLCNARELQRAEATSAASVVSLCTETCAGGGTVRAARLQPRMRAAFMRRLDVNHNSLLLLNAANRWLGLSLDLVGALSVCVTLGAALGAGSGSLAGLAGAYALVLPAYLAHLAKGRADLDQHLAALERVHVDTHMPQEDYREHCSIPEDWQRNGKVDFEDVTIKYDPASPPILSNINLSIAPGERVAICGRSGSGKSSLALSVAGAGGAVSAGRVLVDGRDTRSVPLRALRRRVLVLPQEPVLFAGTLRENLDPLAVHTDDEIWTSLRVVGLYEFVTSQSAGLECSAGGRGGGGGWSVGRVARACSARAALRARRAAVLVLDEPAAALDAPAERALLAALAAHAPDTTILTVAHRVSSVRGYGRAVVLDGGRAAEVGAVGALLAQPASRLAAMMQHAHTLT